MRLHLHRWRYLYPSMSGRPAWRHCRRCGRMETRGFHGWKVLWDENMPTRERVR
jgi:hypothetical protein